MKIKTIVATNEAYEKVMAEKSERKKNKGGEKGKKNEKVRHKQNDVTTRIKRRRNLFSGCKR